LLTDEIIDFCASSPKFQHHFHIPLQSGSDRILGLMRRRYTTARFADRIAAVRRRMPDAFIGIDVIVGFPGETEADFRTTYDFLTGIAPAFLHTFPFSEPARYRRPSTSPGEGARRSWPLAGSPPQHKGHPAGSGKPRGKAAAFYAAGTLGGQRTAGGCRAHCPGASITRRFSHA